MTEETEVVIDRRRMRRSVSFWRTTGIAALALAIGAFAFGGERLTSIAQPAQIARVSIEGTILENRDQLKMLDKIADSSKVAALLVYVNSPGGTTAGGEALFNALRAVSKKKPVVAQFGTIAASAGYIVGIGADHIVARGNTITGSMGVIAQWPEFVGLLDKVGVKMNEVKSGNLKATPSPFLPLDDNGRSVMQAMIADGFRWFQGLVEERRNIKTADVPGLDQGTVFSGRDALKHKLVDEIGGEDEAVAWLENVRGVQKDLKIIDWKPKRDDDWGVTSAMASFTGRVAGAGAAEITRVLGRETGISQLALDGLVSVWHPAEK
ncbi:MAG: signal peptide peptidase SppA [Hyphomicrobiaceae bacterium]|nr:signal peptide peptidase SppA [Hyphomicrobiaceae bacterium]